MNTASYIILIAAGLIFVVLLAGLAGSLRVTSKPARKEYVVPREHVSPFDPRLARLASLLSLSQPRKPRTPDVPPTIEDQLPRVPPPRFDASEETYRAVPVADLFDLSEQIRSHVRDVDELIDVVRAILEASGARVRSDGDVLRTGAHAIVVIPGHLGRPLIPDELNSAYLRFKRSGAPHGLVVSLGYMDKRDVRRRELLAPEVRHVGRKGIQRMADASAMGVDPLECIAAA